MENTLKTLFDFQRFESNDRLSKLIEATESKYMSNMTALSDDDLSMISAAGKTTVDSRRSRDNLDN